MRISGPMIALGIVLFISICVAISFIIIVEQCNHHQNVCHKNFHLSKIKQIFVFQIFKIQIDKNW